MFADLAWEATRLSLDGVEFRLEQENDLPPITDRGTPYFRFYKNKALMTEYDTVLGIEPSTPVRRMLEIGMWDGGSAALWLLTHRPEMLIGVDHSDRGDSDYFRKVVEGRGLADRVVTSWGTDQRDRQVLQRLVREHAAGELDLVTDDGSHVYGPTKAAFEALFPMLKPGGWYIIEDWAWEHWRDWQGFEGERSPEPLLRDAIASVGSNFLGISQVMVSPGLFALRRAPCALDPQSFRISDEIWNRPSMSLGQRARIAARPLKGAGRRANPARAWRAAKATKPGGDVESGRVEGEP